MKEKNKSSRSIKIDLPFQTDYFEDFYKNYRDSIDDLFLSETKFLNKVVNKSEKILDVGCAIGGMNKIVKKINPNISYTGIDVSKKLIDVAKKIYPLTNFIVGDGINLPFNKCEYDSVISFGTTVHDQDYKRLINDCLRVTKKYFLFDIRLINSLPTINDLNLGYVDDDSSIRYPYVVINFNEFIEFLKSLKGIRVNIYGYFGSANEFTSLPKGYEKICMTGVLIEKIASVNTTFSKIEIPF